MFILTIDEGMKVYLATEIPRTMKAADARRFTSNTLVQPPKVQLNQVKPFDVDEHRRRTVNARLDKESMRLDRISDRAGFLHGHVFVGPGDPVHGFLKLLITTDSRSRVVGVSRFSTCTWLLL